PTEFTSYLVLEPGMTVGPMPRDERARILPAVAGAGSVAPSAPPPSAFEQARAAAKQREARSVAEADATMDRATSRRTTNRMFVLRDSVWVDTRATAATVRHISVRAYSDAYFALMDSIPELREAFALGDRVKVRGRAVTIVLAADGVDRLQPRELGAAVRDW